MASTQYVYMFNSPQYFDGHIGHDGILFQTPDGRIHLYSFHPVLNRGEFFEKGSIAHIVNEDDAASFEAFEKACMTPRPKLDDREDDRGIVLNNGTVTWVERIRRVVRMGVTKERLDSMMSFAEKFARHPHRFNFITYSCQHFVNQTLSTGGITMYGKHLPLTLDLVPNSVFDRVTDRTTSILSFDKIDFERLD